MDIKDNTDCCCGKIHHSGFKLFKDDNDYYSFIARKKFDSGMTGEISFDLYQMSEGSHDVLVDISFVVYRKRKSAWGVPNEITGRDGAATLVWANEQINAFSEFVWNKTVANEVTLVIGWTDKKRGDLYKKVLTQRGFSIVRDEGEIVLKKKIHRIPLKDRKYQFAR